MTTPLPLRRIPVKSGAPYPGRLNTDRTGEVYRGTIVTEQTEVLIHASDDPIRAFRPIETCFYREGFLPYGHLYAMIVPKGTVMDVYPSDEVRLVPSEAYPIVYVGRAEMISVWDGDRGRWTTDTRYSGWVADYAENSFLTEDGIAALLEWERSRS